MEIKEILNHISILIEEITDIHIRIRTESENIKDIDLELMNNKSVELYDYVQKLKQLDLVSSRIENTVETQQNEKENRFTYTSDEGLELLEDDKTETTTHNDKEERENESEKAENTGKEIDDEFLKGITEKDTNENKSEENDEEVKATDSLEENELKKEAQQSHLFEQEEAEQNEKELEADNQDDEGSSNDETQETDKEVVEREQETVKSESSQTDNNSQVKTSINERFSGMHTSSLNEKFSRENMNRMLADKLKLTPVSDLKSAISINQQAAFIDQLFKGNKKEYKRSIEFLNKCGNYSEAKFYIHSELSNKYQWKVDNKLVEELIELVYRRFL